MGELRQKYPFMKKTFHTLISLILSLSPAFLIFSCSRSPLQEELDFAETRMETRPDSALSILKGIDKSALNSNKDRARYALLMSMALDKNYIDTTSFDILQPAIDYYLPKGTADEKLRTYYYQGVIYLNQGDRDRALSSFMKGREYFKEGRDSLSMALTFVAQGLVYKDFYDFRGYTHCFLEAAKIYQNLSYPRHRFDCLLNALNAAIIVEDKNKGDSILVVCDNLCDLDRDQELHLKGYRLSHALEFGDIFEIKRLMEYQETNHNLDTNGLLNLASAYNKLGKYAEAKQLLDYINNNSLGFDTLKYYAILVPILENMDDCSGGCGYYRSRNINENGHFNLCPIQKDLSILADCLILSLDKSKIKYNSQISAL
ncbi:MAG: hypothetical protein K2G69_08145 [Muribaculaceae bacterium]|nr:hypothetical protein [Muribaculaceae bacterium]